MSIARRYYRATAIFAGSFRSGSTRIPSGRATPRSLRKFVARYGPRIVLAVGRMVYYKGFEYLVQAMASVNGHLLLVGEGPLQAKLERQAFEAALGIESPSWASLTGRVIGYYHAADVFVMPSIARSEAFGIAQLEAMACGKPVVNTRLCQACRSSRWMARPELRLLPPIPASWRPR